MSHLHASDRRNACGAMPPVARDLRVYFASGTWEPGHRMTVVLRNEQCARWLSGVPEGPEYAGCLADAGDSRFAQRNMREDRQPPNPTTRYFPVSCRLSHRIRAASRQPVSAHERAVRGRRSLPSLAPCPSDRRSVARAGPCRRHSMFHGVRGRLARGPADRAADNRVRSVPPVAEPAMPPILHA